MSPHTEDRRHRSLKDELLGWLAPLSLALNLFFLHELYQDVRQMRDDLTAVKLDVATLKSTPRPAPVAGGTTP